MTKNILLPTRPGTLWSPLENRPYGLLCEHCGKYYGAHGATEAEATKLGVPFQHRHRICPASDVAWEEYNEKYRKASYNATRQEVINALTEL